MKGLGGFQLLVDATNATAVTLLRGSKQRPDKPFALMFGSLEAVRAACNVCEEESRALTSHQAPIVLLRRNERVAGQITSNQTGDGSPRSSDTENEWSCATASVPVFARIAQEVAPGNPYLGVMLPFSPLHHLLMELRNDPWYAPAAISPKSPWRSRPKTHWQGWLGLPISSWFITAPLYDPWTIRSPGSGRQGLLSCAEHEDSLRCQSTYTALRKKWPMFVVPALAEMRAKNRLKAGLGTVNSLLRAV